MKGVKAGDTGVVAAVYERRTATRLVDEEANKGVVEVTEVHGRPVAGEV